MDLRVETLKASHIKYLPSVPQRQLQNILKWCSLLIKMVLKQWSLGQQLSCLHQPVHLLMRLLGHKHVKCIKPKYYKFSDMYISNVFVRQLGFLLFYSNWLTSKILKISCPSPIFPQDLERISKMAAVQTTQSYPQGSEDFVFGIFYLTFSNCVYVISNTNFIYKLQML